jgi:hypothetical protein
MSIPERRSTNSTLQDLELTTIPNADNGSMVYGSLGSTIGEVIGGVISVNCCVFHCPPDFAVTKILPRWHAVTILRGSLGVDTPWEEDTTTS